MGNNIVATQINASSNIENVKKYGMIILVLFTILEIIFHFSYENLLGCALFLGKIFRNAFCQLWV